MRYPLEPLDSIGNPTRRRLAENILAGPWLAPSSRGHAVNASILDAHWHNEDTNDIRFALDVLVTAGFVVQRPSSEPLADPNYAATAAGSRAREILLHNRHRRPRCLLRQTEHDLSSLIVAIAMYPKICNRRIRGGFFGLLEEIYKDELLTYLWLRDPDEVLRCADDLISKQRLSTRTIEQGDLYSITGLGEREYRRRIQAELMLQDDQSILDEGSKDKIAIFYAWQKDYKISRNHIKDALDRITAVANDGWRPVAPVEVVEAIDPGDGASHIDSILFEKIRDADLFVADITPVAYYSNKLVPNSNVLIEVGFALGVCDAARILLIEHLPKTDALLAEAPSARLPFDIDHASRLSYKEPKELRAKAEQEIREMLRRLGKVD